jgi:hypothetical protein
MPLRDNEPLYPNLFKGIVGYWSPSAGPTGNRLRDLSGYNNHGTLTNMNAGTDWVVSGGKYALDFDAVDDYIQLASYGSLPNTGAISLQLNARPVTTSFPNAFGTESFTNNNHGFRLELSSANTLALVVGSTTSFTGHSAGTITSNKWEHILITWNVSENRIQILQNGIIRSDTTNTTWPSNLNNIRLGVGFTLGRYWNGLLDDFILYNRALSRNEQISIFRLGRGGILRSRQRAPYLATQELSTTFVKKDGEWCETEKSYIKKNNVWVPSNPVIYTNGNWR